LKGLKTELKKWTRENCYKDKNRKHEVVQEIERLDQKDEDLGLEEVLRKRRVELLSVLNELNEKEMVILRQKSRVDWIVKRDRNSRYFHSRIRWRRKTNELNALTFNGQWIDGPNLVKGCVKRFIEEKFAAKQEMGWSLDGVQFKSLSMDQNKQLCKCVTKDEVEQAVGQCVSTKSPRLDGFNFNFIKKNWDTVGDEFIKSVLSFFELGFIPRGCNASFIALIPKRENPMSLHDFRPISLEGCVYKVITMVLADKIKNVFQAL